jgi:hypothetical protein
VDHFLEGVKFGVPFAWEGAVVRFDRIENGLEFFLVLDEKLIESLESRKL